MTVLTFDPNLDAAAALKEFNAAFAFTVIGGRARIAEPKCWDPSLERHYVRFVPLSDFKSMFANWRVNVPTTKGKYRPVPIAELWLASPDRRQHLGGVVCDPGGQAGPDFLNVWQGFAVKPKPGNCQIILDHIHEVVCRGDDQIYDYAISWLATKVQFPGVPPETAFVMRGEKGTGKGTLGHTIRKVFGVHGMYITQAEHLVGKFNQHLLNCCLLFADEAFFAGDKRHEKVLQALITEPTLVIEKKGIDAFQAVNRLGIIMATNSNWAVPASADERRYFVVDVSEARRGDRDYFTKLWQAVSDPEVLAAFLYELLEVDLNGFQIRDIPHTEGLNDQKLASLNDFHKWLMRCLYLGYLPDPDPKITPPWSNFWITTSAYQAFEDWARMTGTARFALNAAQFGKEMTRFYRPSRPRMNNPGHQPGYQLGTLEDARNRFCEVQKLDIDWGEEWPE
jgi:phage/plasmid-associated DNA primase